MKIDQAVIFLEFFYKWYTRWYTNLYMDIRFLILCLLGDATSDFGWREWTVLRRVALLVVQENGLSS